MCCLEGLGVKGEAVAVGHIGYGDCVLERTAALEGGPLGGAVSSYQLHQEGALRSAWRQCWLFPVKGPAVFQEELPCVGDPSGRNDGLPLQKGAVEWGACHAYLQGKAFVALPKELASNILGAVSEAADADQMFDTLLDVQVGEAQALHLGGAVGNRQGD